LAQASLLSSTGACEGCRVRLGAAPAHEPHRRGGAGEEWPEQRAETDGGPGRRHLERPAAVGGGGDAVPARPVGEPPAQGGARHEDPREVHPGDRGGAGADPGQHARGLAGGGVVGRAGPRAEGAAQRPQRLRSCVQQPSCGNSVGGAQQEKARREDQAREPCLRQAPPEREGSHHSQEDRRGGHPEAVRPQQADGTSTRSVGAV